MTKRYVGHTEKNYQRFFASDGTTPEDPASLVLRVKSPIDPDERRLVYGVDAELVRESVGVYYFEAFYQVPGRHWLRWEWPDGIVEEWTKIEPSAFVHTFQLTATGITTSSPQLQTPTVTEV